MRSPIVVPEGERELILEQPIPREEIMKTQDTEIANDLNTDQAPHASHWSTASAGDSGGSMAGLTLKTRDGATVILNGDVLEAFSQSLRGQVVTPQSSDYDEVRSIWNAMIDRRPGLIARCMGVEDVTNAVNLARDHKLFFSVRGAGHNIAGNSLCDDGLLIDLSLMKSIQVDEEKRTARVDPGVTLGDLDRATQAFALAAPVGINSTTGVAGLTLGGGFGWLSRKHGLTIDNLLSAEVVTATGERSTVSESRHPDLFWGIRGGGGNFGIVTAFEYQLHPVGPDVFSGLIVHPHRSAKEVLSYYRQFAAAAPEELTVWAVLRKAPPLPFLPEDVHGTAVVVLASLYAGDISEGEKLLEPLRRFGSPLGEAMSAHKFTDWQAAFDPLLARGARNYWKSHNFRDLSDGLVATALDYAAKLPTDQSEIFIAQMGGATNRVPADATAYTGRDAEFIMNVHTRWDDPGDDDRCIAWARDFFNASAAYATGGAYINFMPEDEAGRVETVYGKNYERLAALKKKYDPDNLFRMNHNIHPAG
jgi:FAD/FMN-containing dehydrogenase